VRGREETREGEGEDERLSWVFGSHFLLFRYRHRSEMEVYLTWHAQQNPAAAAAALISGGSRAFYGSGCSCHRQKCPVCHGCVNKHCQCARLVARPIQAAVSAASAVGATAKAAAMSATAAAPVTPAAALAVDPASAEAKVYL
jgi:hypothetical protein